jgi:hypothetical protein
MCQSLPKSQCRDKIMRRPEAHQISIMRWPSAVSNQFRKVGCGLLADFLFRYIHGNQVMQVGALAEALGGAERVAKSLFSAFPRLCVR